MRLTKEELEQYIKLKREIGSLNKRLDKLFDKDIPIIAGKITASSKDFPYTPYHVSVEMEDPKLADEVNKTIRLLEDRKERCSLLMLRIEQFIDQIKDSELRQVFEYRFIDGMKLKDIAKIVNLDLSVVGKKISNYLKLANNAKKTVI